MKRTIKIVFFSDTHNHHRVLGYGDFWKADIAVFCGDMCGYTYLGRKGGETEMKYFVQWFSDMPVPHKVFIAGNHDFALEGKSPFYGKATKIHYLYNSGCVIKRLRFWGSPISRPYNNWAFNVSDVERKRIWKLIPQDTDILVTHAPPYGFLDDTYDGGKHYGDEFLLEEISKRERKPKIMAFGHVHGGYGETTWGSVKLINCSVVNESYELVHKPITALVEDNGFIKRYFSG